MSEQAVSVKRFDFYTGEGYGEALIEKDGEYVKYEDYAALQFCVDEMKAQLQDAPDKIVLLVKVLAAVNATPEGGVVCPDVGNANWFDARDYALRAAGCGEGV